MQGAIAEVFGALLRRIWSDSLTAASYSPREFKQTLQRFAPQFIGYQQHDSQELLAFLLDGLHEDLNRILKKPYVENPDWEGGGDEEVVKLANTSWEGYLRRNDSVIVDLFQGQYKSTLVCPECAKVRKDTPSTNLALILLLPRSPSPLIRLCTSRYLCRLTRSGLGPFFTCRGTQPHQY
jgi:ubiquitin carboxyl-terminal hydrolase 4/11/15